MKVTVVVCTHNRCKTLSRTLSSVAACVVRPSVQWEVVVVDNNSSDLTRQVIEDFCTKYPMRFRCLFEPRPGKSYALNSAIRQSDADVLAFLDDDVTVDLAWLDRLTSGWVDGSWAGAGGKIVLEWPEDLPGWVSIRGPYAKNPLPDFDEGSEAKELKTAPFGTNMVFRREMFEKYGFFRTDLGPSPRREVPRPGEDTEFGWRLIAAGERLWYEPSAIVYHPVPHSRITKEYYLEWWFDLGRAKIRMFGVRNGTKFYLAGVPFYLFASLALWTVRWVFSLRAQARFYYRVMVWGKLGEIAECYRRRVTVDSGTPRSINDGFLGE